MPEDHMKLRLIAVNGELLGPVEATRPPTDITTVRMAMAIGRRCANILAAPPANGFHFSDDELAAHYAATDRMIEAFRVLDRLLTEASGVQI
jgi:hypothetical protein